MGVNTTFASRARLDWHPDFLDVRRLQYLPAYYRPARQLCARTHQHHPLAPRAAAALLFIQDRTSQLVHRNHHHLACAVEAGEPGGVGMSKWLIENNMRIGQLFDKHGSRFRIDRGPLGGWALCLADVDDIRSVLGPHGKTFTPSWPRARPPRACSRGRAPPARLARGVSCMARLCSAPLVTSGISAPLLRPERSQSTSKFHLSSVPQRHSSGSCLAQAAAKRLKTRCAGGSAWRTSCRPRSCPACSFRSWPLPSPRLSRCAMAPVDAAECVCNETSCSGTHRYRLQLAVHGEATLTAGKSIVRRTKAAHGGRLPSLPSLLIVAQEAMDGQADSGEQIRLHQLLRRMAYGVGTRSTVGDMLSEEEADEMFPQYEKLADGVRAPVRLCRHARAHSHG
jgi:hypothetical protein